MIKQSIRRFAQRLLTGNETPQARVYGVGYHKIDKKLVSRNAIKVCEVLQENGFQAYIVGGAVRDLILGLQPKDFDVATDARPEQIQKLFRRARIIGKRFKLVHVVFGHEIIETSTFRAPYTEGKNQTSELGRVLSDNIFGTLEQDASRRDFTFNALYYDPIKQEVIDYHHGLADLNNRTVRMIGDPSTRYREDPVRILRAIRFAAKLNGTIEKNTLAPIASLAHLIPYVPASRLYDEGLKLLLCGNAIDCLKFLHRLDLLKGTFPILEFAINHLDNRFLQIALERTDQRIRRHLPVSPSFTYAAVLWPLVYEEWQKAQATQPPAPALIEVVHNLTHNDTMPDDPYKFSLALNLVLQRRYVSEMREIWLMQSRFEKRNKAHVLRVMTQPRFRAAVDFLQIRAACHECDSVLAQWWMDLADTPYEQRMDFIDASGTSHTIQTKKKRKKSNSRRSRQSARLKNIDLSDFDDL